MKLSGKKILVTGAEGFIGSHLVEELVASGCKVRALSLYNSFNTCGWLDHLSEHVRSEIEVCSGDIRDPWYVNRLVRGMDIVYNLAALIGIPYSYQAPDSYVATNITGTLNLMEAGRLHDIERMVHISTSEVYGSAQFVPIKESHPLSAQSPYAATKIGAEQLALSYYRSFNLPVVVVRPFNTYGPRQSARAVIPSIIIQIAAKNKKVHLGSLSPTRDFTFVKDTARGLVAAAKAAKVEGEVINIGSGFEVSIGETLKIIGSIMNAKVPVAKDRKRERPNLSEVTRLWADISKARKLLRWEPEYKGKAGFKEGLKQTVTWYTNLGNLKHYKTRLYNV